MWQQRGKRYGVRTSLHQASSIGHWRSFQLFATNKSGWTFLIAFTGCMPRSGLPELKIGLFQGFLNLLTNCLPQRLCQFILPLAGYSTNCSHMSLSVISRSFGLTCLRKFGFSHLWWLNQEFVSLEETVITWLKAHDFKDSEFHDTNY